MDPRSCERCGTEFQPKVKWQKFCTGACTTKARNQRRNTDFSERACAGPACERTIKPKASDHRYCSDRCARAGRRAKQELLNPGDYSPARAQRQSHPEGWEPGVVWDGTAGTVTSKPTTDQPKWDDLLRSWNFDPEQFQIVEPVQVRTWEAAIGDGQTKQFWYYRANIVSRVRQREADLEDLCAEIRRYRPRKQAEVAGDDALVVCLADWQAGKRDGDGLDGLVKRALAGLEGVKQRVGALRRAGHTVANLYLFGMGDLVEGCGEFYEQQTFTVELDRRQQTRIVRRLLTKYVLELAPDFERVVVAGVGGNHGENRRNGKSFTTFGDNDDVAVFEQVADAIGLTERAPNTSFVVPDEELSLTLDIAGHIVGIAHGHQAERAKGSNPQDKMWSWWMGQAMGREPIGDADVLIGAHWHHFTAREDAGRLLVQCPPLDGGSKWFRDRTGRDSVPGTLTLHLWPGGWGNVQIIR